MGQFSAEDLERLEGEGEKLGAELEEQEAVISLEPKEEPEEQEQEPQEPEVTTPQEFRYGDDAPEELRGKTPAEALGVYQNLRGFAQNLYSNYAGQQQQAPPPEEDNTITEDELLSSNAESINTKLQRLLDAKAGPFIHDAYQKLSLAAMEAAERNTKDFPYFGKYRNEILQLASQLPVQQTSDPQTWKLIHDRVKLAHVDEILEEEIARRTAAANGETEEEAPTVQNNAPRPKSRQRQLPFTERGNNSPSTNGKNKTYKLSDAELTIARGLGVKPEDYSTLAPMFKD